MTVCLSVVSRIMQTLLVGTDGKKNQKMVCGPTWIPLTFVTDLDHRLDTKKVRFSHLLIITCFGGSLHSPSALVGFSFCHLYKNTPLLIYVTPNLLP